MPSVRLSRYEAEEGDLPDVCMRCGAPAAVRKRYAFTWHPLWTYLLLPFGFLPYVVVAAVLTQRVRCYTLLCERHKWHWLVRTLVVWGGFALMLLLIVGGFALMMALGEGQTGGAKDRLFGLFCVGMVALILAWLISIPVTQVTAIHPTESTHRTVTLARVSPAFIDALLDHRDRRRAALDAERPARRPDAADEFYDPDRPRRRGDPEAFRAED